MEASLGRHRSSSGQLGPGGGEDRISALPDDLLLLVLAHLPCAGAAARAGVLSRRWRGLWARLRRIVLRDVPFHCLGSALARVPLPPPTVSLLKICLPEQRRRIPKVQLVDTARLDSLLRAAALLDPEEFSLVIPPCLVRGNLFIHLPCFNRATSIVMDLCSIIVSLPTGVEFPALETLSMSGCVADFDELLSRCHRLRTLRLKDVSFLRGVLSVNSPLLQELVVAGAWIHHVNIIAPVLTQLTMSLNTYQEFGISILAPIVEKVSWDCRFSMQSSVFGLWRLEKLSLKVAQRQGQLPSLHIHGFISSSTSDDAQELTKEIEKRLIAAFSVLELNLETKGHVYGAFVSYVLENNRICCAIQTLKINLKRLVMEEEGCLPDCPCEPTDWKSQTFSLTALEEVELSGFGDKDHDIDMLKWILSCAPMLKRMIMKLSQEASANNDGCTKVYNIFKAYSSVQCYVYLSSGLMHGSRNCPST